MNFDGVNARQLDETGAPRALYFCIFLPNKKIKKRASMVGVLEFQDKWSPIYVPEVLNVHVNEN